jgi:hypothetical protein
VPLEYDSINTSSSKLLLQKVLYSSWKAPLICAMRWRTIHFQSMILTESYKNDFFTCILHLLKTMYSYIRYAHHGSAHFSSKSIFLHQAGGYKSNAMQFVLTEYQYACRSIQQPRLTFTPDRDSFPYTMNPHNINKTHQTLQSIFQLQKCLNKHPQP